MVTTALNLNLTPGGVPLNLHVTQYDAGFRTYEFTPYSSPGTVDLSLASSVTLEATKPDGHAIINNCTYDSGTNKITYTVQQQLCACIGKVWSKVVIRDTNDNVLGTAAVIWIVEPAGVNDGAIMSDSDISALEEFVGEFGTINAYKTALDACLAAAGGTRVASTVAGMTDHNYVYVYTGSETGYIAGNWYYWDGSEWTSGGVYQANYNLDTTLTQSGKAADAKAVGDGLDELKSGLDEAIEEFAVPTQEAVDNWLNSHPEATTTVQDHSLSYVKLINGTLGFVTPEMFGAVGDGVTDDTQAWQSAVDFGLDVLATKNKYKCGQINVTNNISIDCNSADFTCTASTLFHCSGDVLTSLSEADYTANKQSYALSSTGYTDYTGMAFLKGTNNFMPTRTYYVGGFSCYFENGYLSSPYPIPVTSVTVDIIKPITVTIGNIGTITHSNAGSNISILIEYGFNCTVHDINSADYASYIVVDFSKCLNCRAYNLAITNVLTRGNNNSYIVAFIDSSYCGVSESHLINKHWHAITTGGTYLSYKNRVENSVLLSEGSFAYADHDDGLGTEILNCTISAIFVTGLCHVKNVDVVTVKSLAVSITVSACPISSCAIYDIEDITFIIDGTLANNSSNGIRIAAIAEQETGVTKYISKASIKGCKTTGSGITIYLDSANTETLVMGEVFVDNFGGAINLGRSSGATNINISNYNLSVMNCTANKAFGSGSTMEFGNVNFNNCNLYNLRGVYKDIIFSNLTVYQQINNATVSGAFVGDCIKGYIRNSAMVSATRLSIGMMSINDTYSYFNLANSANGTKYYQSYNNDGTLTSTQIT